MNLRQLVLDHIGPYKRRLLIVILLQTIQTAATLMLPSLNGDIIDKGVLPGDNAYIRRTGVTMLGFTLMQVVFATAAVWIGSQIAMGFGRDVRRNLFHQVTSYSAREVGQFGAPSLITRITNDVQQVQMLVVMAVTMMIAAPITMVVGVIMALRQDTGLSIVLVVSVPAAVILLGSVIALMVPAFQRMQFDVDRVNQVLREQITGIRVVRAFVREPEETARFAEANQELTDTSLRTGRLQAAMFPTIIFILNVTSIGVLWIGADRIGAGSTNLGSMVAYLNYVIQILMAVVMMTFMLSMVPRAAVAAERIQEVLKTPPSVVPAAQPVTEVNENGTLEFREVGFNYAGAEQGILEGVSFRIEAGQTLAVVGSTGAGKTTLVNLISRLADATSGAVLVDGVDVRDLDPDLLWSKVGYVPQKQYLFSGTVGSNLRYGRPGATEAQMWEALEVAQAADFVRSMPDGLDSEIKQGGTNVSGGQRQRLSIARALVVKPEIYVFDDSFSALDLETDARLRAALAPYTADAAVLIVAQRISTVSDADQILVLEDGQIVGLGTHDDLVAGCATYAEIVESQLGEGAAA